MPKIVSSGKCRLCGQLVGKAQLTTHLKKCLKRSSPNPAQGAKTTRCFHLVVGATYDPAYWLHLELPAEATFAELDRVLRDIWLECCGHMSKSAQRRQRILPNCSSNSHPVALPVARKMENESCASGSANGFSPV